MSALGTTERTSDARPVLRRQVGDGAGGRRRPGSSTRSSGRASSSADGGALPTFVRQVKLSPVVTVIGPGTQRIAADLARRRRRSTSRASSTTRARRAGPSSSAAPTPSTWNELYLTIASVLGKRRRLVHVPFGVARAGARLTQWLPGAPLTVDQVAMIEAGDNVVSNTDAADTFQLPLVPLEDQLRRAAA